MRLKSLEMQGFKSFPEKTVLNFDDGITAIVGPNGSGKSNISDAVRWVLGEQSTRTLRGSKMEDVIFGGTQKRGPVGFAEVSITIDNSDGVLPTEYSEVTITRRLYRSGESEYYINRNAVRLRDIHELFMDTGLGRDGYSIIGQGRIDEILALKSEDRREIFEEASGISKFRHRKEEAERKLNATEENLVRIRDIISELELQLQPLATQAEEAKQYLKIYDELRGLETSLWLHNIEKIKANAEKIVNDFEVANSQFERGQSSLDELYSEIERISEAMREKDSELERVREDLHGAEGAKHDIESEISYLKATIENNTANIERIKAEIAEGADRAGGIGAQIEERRAQIEDLNTNEREISLKVESISQSILSADKSRDGLSARLETLRGKEQLCELNISELRIKLSSADTHIENLNARKSRISGELSDKKGELESAVARFSEIKSANAEAQETLSGIENSLKGYELKAASREKRAAAAREELRKAELQMDSLKSKHKILTDMERDYEGYFGSVKSVMRAHERGALRGIYGTVSQLMRVEDEYTVAIETILGGALQNIVVDDDKSAREAIAFLKNTNAGRATFLPLSSVRGDEIEIRDLSGKPGFISIASRLVSYDNKYAGIFKNLLGRIAVVDNLNNASAIAKSFGYRFRIVTLDGQIINAGGSYTGGSIGKNVGILSRLNEIKKLEAKLSDLSGGLEKLVHEKNEAEREFNALSYEIEVYKAERRKAEDILLKTKTEMEHHESLLSGIRQSIALLESEDSEITDKLNEWNNARGEALSGISGIEADMSGLKAEIEALLSEHSEIAEKKSSLSERLSEIRLKLAEIRTERAESEKALSQLVALQSDMEGDRLQKQRLIDEYTENNNKVNGQIAEKQSKIEELINKMSEIKQNEERVLSERLALEAKRNKKDKESKDLNDDILKLERERSRLESRKDSILTEEKQIIDKLWETYELTPITAKEHVIQLESVTGAEKRISRLKAERKKLGAVNVGAIDEYDRVSKRYSFLSEQKNDLEKAKNELTSLIERITGEMEEIFAKQFKVINESFGETFVEIFGGGRAELTLADPDDILNCGIEIRVQPPGKTLKTITLLSGGERAFVAIALYFAIIKVRPTPFCVLDEIEAALDDVNVSRFAGYLRRLSDRTQFIIITHRRGTMEEADILYGVTMQEQGISKMLTISIADVEKQLNIKLK